MFLRVENKSQWEEPLDKALFKTFFHTLEWENFLEKELSWLKFERYVWRDGLLLSIARCRLFGREKLVSHPLCEYGGPLPLKSQFDLKGFVQDFEREFGESIRIKFHPYILKLHNSPQPPAHIASEALAGRPLTLRGGTTSTFWVEDFSKRTLEDLWQGLRKTLKQEIKKAQNAGITMGECADEKELRHFYNLYLNTVKRHKNIPLPYSIFQFFKSSANAKIFIAKRDVRVLGGSIFLFYKPFIHYFINASDYRLHNLSIGHAILWHVMQKYVGGGYDYFDLGGTRKGSALEVFKRGWGANERPIYEIGGRDAARRDSILRNIWSFLPTQAMERLAPLFLWMKV